MKSLKYEVFLILIIFDTYYIPTKYPNELPDGIPAEVYTEKIAKNALILAEKIVKFVKQKYLLYLSNSLFKAEIYLYWIFSCKTS